MQTFSQMSPEMASEVYPDYDIDERSRRAWWPSTLDFAVGRLMDGMDEKSKERVRDTKKEDLISFYLGLGTGIRNEFGLWGGNTNLPAECHTNDPEEASMVIIETFWKKLQTEK
jgi:uncharacterized protein DUF6794